MTTKLLYQFNDKPIAEAPALDADRITLYNSFNNFKNQQLLSLSVSGSSNPYTWLSVYQDLSLNYIWINSAWQSIMTTTIAGLE